MTPNSISWYKRTVLIICVTIFLLVLTLLRYPTIVSSIFTHQPNIAISRKDTPAIAVPVYDPSMLTWTAAITSAPWEARDSQSTFTWHGKIFMMGGLNGNGHVDANGVELYWRAKHFNDIWSTTDGANWIEETAHAAWAPRRSMSVVEFHGKLWMIGGFSPRDGLQSDIWQSDNGVVWTKVVSHAAFIPREGQTVEVFKDRLWIIGGVNYKKREALNDIWYSDDGIDWILATSSAAWSPRWDHDTEVFNGKMYLASGMDLSMQIFNDIWVTDDGITWTELNAHAPWASRQGGQLIAFHGLLWIIGRLNDKAEDYGPNDIWYSSDGISWQKTAVDPPWTGREDYAGILFNNQLYIFAGMGVDGDSWRWKNDVWVSSDTFSLTTMAENINAPLLVSFATSPNLSAGAFISVYVNKDGIEYILAKKNESVAFPIASLTKLMTALVGLDRLALDAPITLTPSALAVKGASSTYHAGVHLSFREALAAMLISSHNEVAAAIAEAAGPDFVAAMNTEAGALGLSNTDFSNPIGIDPNSANGRINHSSPYDVYRLIRAFARNAPNALGLTLEQTHVVKDFGGTDIATITTTNRLLSETDLPYAIRGGKTGETPFTKKNIALLTDGPCGGTIYTVVLGSNDNFADTRTLLNYDASAYNYSCK
ncbi:D-alanyl-D-alanine carboxypeptidase [Candidatus Kaiserbacteria bacterium]|nr:D-alanyl-D-alanine carboxypeptidase [Candidatus Kaiserbacteria bacterium]